MGNQQVMEVCFTRNKEFLDQKCNDSNSIIKEFACENKPNLVHVDRLKSLPFCRTHINLFKSTMDQVTLGKFTKFQFDRFAKKFGQLNIWQEERYWEKNSDLELLMTQYMPDSSQSGLISYTSAMGLGLLLCAGSTYDKTKILFEILHQTNKQKTVFRNDDQLTIIVYCMIDFSVTHAIDFNMRDVPKDPRKQNKLGSIQFKENGQVTISEQHPAKLFLQCLFGEFVCLSKMDFIMVMQCPHCSWIFDQQKIRDQIERQQQHESTKSNSEWEARSDMGRSDMGRSDMTAKAKMIECNDELQYCLIEKDFESDPNIDLEC